MQLSETTIAAVRATWDWFCVEKELTQESEEIFADYLKNIENVAVEEDAKILAGEAWSFWIGYINTHSCQYPRLAEARFNGMYKRLMILAQESGAIISELQPDYPVPARPQDNLPSEDSGTQLRSLET